MPTGARSRPELREAGDGGPLRSSSRGAYPRIPPKKPPMPSSRGLCVKISPPNSLPTTPRAPLSRGPPLTKSVLSPKKPPRTLPPTLPASPPPLPQPLNSSVSVDTSDPSFVGIESVMSTSVSPDDGSAVAHAPDHCSHALSGSRCIILCRRTTDCKNPSPASENGSADSATDSCIISDKCKSIQAKACQSSVAKTDSSLSKCLVPLKEGNCCIILPTSTSDNSQRRHSSATGRSRSSSMGLDYHSLDDNTLAQLVAAKKAAACGLSAQRKLKVLGYGRKPGKASRVVPDDTSFIPVNAEPQRCKFITAQSDPICVAYHDQEWGVPVHDDRMLFELLVLAGAQAELSWTTILHKRMVYRDIFRSYEPAVVASFRDKDIQLLASDKALMLSGAKLYGVVENARRALQVVQEFGSLSTYFWSFFNDKPMINEFRYPKQLPAKTSKSEFISKDLVKRGFRFVGPTIVYSFMQAAGMTNDHLVQCFRHKECMQQVVSCGIDTGEMAVFSGVLNGMESDSFDSLVDGAFTGNSKVLPHEPKLQTHHFRQQLIHTDFAAESVHIKAY